MTAGPGGPAGAGLGAALTRTWRVLLPALSIVTFVGAVAAIAWSAGSTLGYDYQAYVQAAGRLLDGKALYDPSVDVAGPFAIYLYPPPFALAMVPFTWLPASAGPGAWTIFLAAVHATAVGVMPVRPTVRWWTLLLSGVCWPFLYSIKLGQVGPLLLLAFAAGWRWRDRPAVTGLATAIGTAIKLQPALLFGWALATGRRRAVAIGVAALIVAALATTALTGLGAWSDYVRILSRVSAPVTTPHNYTIGALAYGAGVGLEAATVLQWLFVGLAAVVVLGAWWKGDPEAGYLATVVGSQVVSPLLWEHYAMLLLLPMAYLLQRRQWWAALIPLAPWLGPPAYPVIFLVGLVAPLLVARRADGRDPAPDARTEGRHSPGPEARPA